MKLSDAIATGRVIVSPTRGFFLYSDNRGCALGMAAVASGLAKRFHLNRQTDAEDWQKALCYEWPWLDSRLPVPPWLTTYEDYLPDGFARALEIIAHTFDRYKEISLDQLIDWIRSVEPQEPETESPQVSPVERTVTLEMKVLHMG